jgi:hypothetical protein
MRSILSRSTLAILFFVLAISAPSQELKTDSALAIKQVQLKELRLEKAQKSKLIGQILTFTGGGLITIGAILLPDSTTDIKSRKSLRLTADITMLAGIPMAIVGIVKWIRAKNEIRSINFSDSFENNRESKSKTNSTIQTKTEQPSDSLQKSVPIDNYEKAE